MSCFIQRVLLFLLPLLLLCACEQTVDVDTPFVERLVVNSRLLVGEPIRVSITKTLPLDRAAAREEGWIGDVSASLLVDGSGERLPLVYSGDSGIYTTATPHLVEAGGRYRLDASWKGLTVTGSTTVPFPVSIDSIRLVPRSSPYELDSSTYTFVARFRPIGEQVYGLSYRLTQFPGSGGITSYGRGNLARRRDTLDDGSIEMMLEAYLDIPPESIDAVLHTFDTPYYDFYQTYYLDNNGDGAFSGGSDLTRWNIEGDGIGLFIGMATTARPLR